MKGGNGTRGRSCKELSSEALLRPGNQVLLLCGKLLVVSRPAWNQMAAADGTMGKADCDLFIENNTSLTGCTVNRQTRCSAVLFSSK